MSRYTAEDFDADRECLYHHIEILIATQVDSPQQVIDRFRCLFIAGEGYPDPAVEAMFHRMIGSKCMEPEFNLILNRCFHIPINRWWHQSTKCEALSELIALFEVPPDLSASSLTTQRLQDLVQVFIKSKEYEGLRRHIWAATERRQQKRTNQAVIEFINRYPLLWPYYLLDQNSSEPEQRFVRQKQAIQEVRVERELLEFAKNRFRSAPASNSTEVAENLTLLIDKALEAAIRHYAGRSEQSGTYRDAARLFSTRVNGAQSYRDFKRILYEELTSFVREAYRDKNQSKKDFDYGRQSFDEWLSRQLREFLPDSDSLKLTRLLRTRTCDYLLGCLLDVPNERRLNHFMFVDLTNVLGSTLTVGLLLKIVLICQDVEPDLNAVRSRLARRLARLFKHYELNIQSGVGWLLENLENWTVASSIQFGKYGVDRWTSLIPDSSA